ncbi:MAG: hypothetical protein QM756_40985 [Polyangiaceae bacterium]
MAAPDVAVNQPARQLITDLECTQIAPAVALLSLHDRVTRSSMEALLPSFETVLGRMRNPGWIIDATDLRDFEPSAVAVGSNWFRAFKAAGGAKVIFVAGPSIAHMAAVTISFAVRIPLETCHTLSEACERLGVTHPPARALRGAAGISGTRPKLPR